MYIWHERFDAKSKRMSFPIKSSPVTLKLPIQVLTTEIESIVPEQLDFDNRKNSTVLVFLDLLEHQVFDAGIKLKMLPSNPP